jgi:hypothetical protein
MTMILFVTIDYVEKKKKTSFVCLWIKERKKYPILIKEVKLIHSDSTCVSSKSTQHIHFDAKVFPSSFILLQKLYHCRLGEFFSISMACMHQTDMD